MKALLIPFLVCIAVCGNAQDTLLTIGVRGGWDVYDYTYTPTPVEGFDHHLEDATRYSFGVQVNGEFPNQVGWGTGLFWAEKGYKIKYSWIAPDGGNGTGDPAIPLETTFRLNYLDIPLEFRYGLLKAAWFHITPSVGIVNSLKIWNSNKSVMGDGSKGSVSQHSTNAKGYLLNGRIAAQIGFDVTKKVFFALEPYAMYAFTDLSADIEDTNLIWGGHLSINYRLK